MKRLYQNNNCPKNMVVVDGSGKAVHCSSRLQKNVAVNAAASGDFSNAVR